MIIVRFAAAGGGSDGRFFPHYSVPVDGDDAQDNAGQRGCRGPKALLPRPEPLFKNVGRSLLCCAPYSPFEGAVGCAL